MTDQRDEPQRDEPQRDETQRGDDTQEGDGDFAEAWEQGDDLDVGADTSQFEAYTGNDTAELLRRQIHDGDDLSDEELRDASEPGGHGPASTGPSATVIIGVLVVVFLVVAVLYTLN